MRPRAVLPQDPLPTEVAGMKISVPRFSPRRLFSSFPPSPLCARHLLRSRRPPGGFQVYPRVSFPRDSPVLNDAPATSLPPSTPSPPPKNAFRDLRARTAVSTQRRATLGDRYRWHKRGVVHDYRRYQPLPAATTPRRVRCQGQMRKYSAVTGD